MDDMFAEIDTAKARIAQLERELAEARERLDRAREAWAGYQNDEAAREWHRENLDAALGVTGEQG
jgi:predicted  nucleic acid-binding Zn-ribbon protein